MPRHFNDFTTYAVPYFRPGPALEDWQGPAAFPQVQIPVVEEISVPNRLLMPSFPDVGNPFIRHYVEPSWDDYVGGSLATSGRSKDVRGSMSRRAQLPLEEQAMVPRYRHVFRSEAASDDALSNLDSDIAALLGEVDDDLGYDDDFGVDDDLDTFLERLGAEKGGKLGLKKPFEAVSKLFRKNPDTGKTRAEEALATVREIELSRQLPPPPPPPPQGLTATQVAMGVGGAVALLGLGFLASQAWSSRG